MPSGLSPLHKTDLVAGFQTLGIRLGDAVEAHSSLSSLGYVAGGAETVIDALMEVVGPQGALVMSAYPVSPALPLSDEERRRGITWKVRILPDDFYQGPEPVRSGLGIIADTFCRRPGTVLGSGLHRVCAWGKDAERHSQGYRYLVESDGWVLLIGVGIDRCSSMHLVEGSVEIPAEIRRLTEPPEELRREYPQDQWDIGYGGTPEDAWQKVWERANGQGLVRKTRIGQAGCSLFKAGAMLRIYEDWLRTDPLGLYGLRP